MEVSQPSQEIDICKVVFGRVCGFWVRVWESHRIFRSSRYGYGSVTEFTEVPGIVAQACITHISSGYGIQRLYPYLEYCGEVLQKSQYCGTVLQKSQKIQVQV